MAFKSDKQPLCRYCGKPIAKKTISLYFGRAVLITNNEYWREFGEKAQTLAEAQRLINHKIVSVRYSGEGKDRHVYKATAWDGES